MKYKLKINKTNKQNINIYFSNIENMTSYKFYFTFLIITIVSKKKTK